MKQQKLCSKPPHIQQLNKLFRNSMNYLRILNLTTPITFFTSSRGDLINSEEIRDEVLTITISISVVIFQIINVLAHLYIIHALITDHPCITVIIVEQEATTVTHNKEGQ